MRRWIYAVMHKNTSTSPPFPRLPRFLTKQEIQHRSSMSGLLRITLDVSHYAKTTGSSPMDVIIKFVERYGEEAHQLLAKEHLAPQLLYCGRVGVHDDDPTF
jgi:hypothetical protein